MEDDPLKGFRFLIWFVIGGLVGALIIKILLR